MAFDDAEVQEWLATRKQEGLKIDPETAEVRWSYVQILDPYGVYRDLPDECYCVGRASFARRPGGDIWVWFGDLPREVRNRLDKKHGWQLDFHAGPMLA